MGNKKHTHAGSALIIVEDSDGNERLCFHVHLGGVWGSPDSGKRENTWQAIRNALLDTFRELWNEHQGEGREDNCYYSAIEEVRRMGKEFHPQMGDKIVVEIVGVSSRGEIDGITVNYLHNDQEKIVPGRTWLKQLVAAAVRDWSRRWMRDE